jgi:hypothetical protein
MNGFQRRVWATLVWIAVSTLLGCMVAGLMAGGPASASFWALVVGGAGHYGVFVLAVATLGAVSGAIIGDLPGLQRARSPHYIVWVEEQRDRQSFTVARESLVLTGGWLMLTLALNALWPMPSSLWLMFGLFGVARAIQLGQYLRLQRLYRQG